MGFISESLGFLELAATEKTETEEKKNEAPALVPSPHMSVLTRALT